MAPGTTMMRFNPYASLPDLKSDGLGGLGVIDPKDWWFTGHSYGLPGTVALFIPRSRMMPPVARQRMKKDLSGLGIIPGEINRTINGLGAIPTDFELATYRDYLPYNSGWVKGSLQGLDDSAEGSPHKHKLLRQSVKNQKMALKLQFAATAALVTLAVFKIAAACRGKG